MKKIFTILAIIAVSTSVFAQTHNISITFDNLTPGSTVGNPVLIGFTITNVGSTTIPTGSSFIVGYNQDGTLTRMNGATYAAGATRLTLQQDLAPSGTISRNAPIQLTFNANIASFCAYGYPEEAGLDINDPNTYSSTDTDLSDNTSCVTVDINATSVKENLSSLTEKMYFANGALVMDIDGYNFNELANVTVMDISGKTIANTSVQLNNGKNTIALSNYTTGIYFVRVTIGSDVATTKVYAR